MKSSFLVLAAVLTGCGWSAPEAAPGPVPLGPPGTTITRLKREKRTFSHTITDILWNDGRGAVSADDRVKTIMDAAPKQLLDRMNMKRKALNVLGAQYEQTVYDARAVIVSLNPDMVIVSLGERKPPQRPGDLSKLFEDWDGTRYQIVRKTLDWYGYWLGSFGLYAGPMAPWADEMYSFSPNPKVGFQRITFENGIATVPLPKGKLVLRRRGIDVDVSRE